MTASKNERLEEVHILRQTLDQTRGVGNYQILREFMLSDQHYAIVRTENDHPDDAYLFRVAKDQVEQIDNEMEWESISDAIDTYLYLQD